MSGAAVNFGPTRAVSGLVSDVPIFAVCLMCTTPVHVGFESCGCVHAVAMRAASNAAEPLLARSRAIKVCHCDACTQTY